METKSRVQFDVFRDRLARIDALMSEIGLETRKDYFDNALTAFEWMIAETRKGNVIGVVNVVEGTYNPLLLPALRVYADRLLTRRQAAADAHIDRVKSPSSIEQA